MDWVFIKESVVSFCEFSLGLKFTPGIIVTCVAYCLSSEIPLGPEQTAGQAEVNNIIRDWRGIVCSAAA